MGMSYPTASGHHKCDTRPESEAHLHKGQARVTVILLRKTIKRISRIRNRAQLPDESSSSGKTCSPLLLAVTATTCLPR